MSLAINRPLHPQITSYFDSPKSAYLHIPFCRRRCYYCDFPVAVVGDRRNGNNSGTIQQYVEVLCQEISLMPVTGPRLETIFFGGGTPSLLSVAQLHHILEVLDQSFGIAANAEVSIEMDPGTFDRAQIQGYQAAGVNRVSLGVQAFQPELLAVCGRSHSVADIYAAIELIHHSAIANFSLDLISGLPHQTLNQWQASLEAAVAIAPQHLSTYDLIVEPVTAFGRQYQPGIRPLPSDTTAAQMYRLAQQVLTSAGYEHYEISNYAQPGYQCRHNRVYWANQSYYGFGMGAASYLQGQRFTRPRKTREYYQWVQAQAEALTSSTPAVDDVSPAETEILLDTLMLGLRMAEGLSVSELIKQFGEAIAQQILTCLQPYYQQGWVEVTEANQQPLILNNWVLDQIPAEARIRLTDPEGFLFSNTVLAALFSELDP